MYDLCFANTSLAFSPPSALLPDFRDPATSRTTKLVYRAVATHGFHHARHHSFTVYETSGIEYLVQVLYFISAAS